MIKKCLALVLILICCGCHSWWAWDSDRKYAHWGGIGFASSDHQEFDAGFFRAEGNSNIYRRGFSFQFPSFGLYGGSDHFSLGILAGFTVYYAR